MALRVVNHLLVRPRDPRFSCPPGNPAHAARHTTRANSPQRTRSTTCLPRPPVPVLARLAGLRYQAPRNLRLPHRLSGLSNLLHAPSVRPPNPQDEPLERRRCKNAAVLAAPPDTPQTTNVDCLSTYSNKTPPSGPLPVSDPISHTSPSSCPQALLRSLPVCPVSVAVKSLSLPVGSFSSYSKYNHEEGRGEARAPRRPLTISYLFRRQVPCLLPPISREYGVICCLQQSHRRDPIFSENSPRTSRMLLDQ